jgi:hypothetical protein
MPVASPAFWAIFRLGACGKLPQSHGGTLEGRHFTFNMRL